MNLGIDLADRRAAIVGALNGLQGTVDGQTVTITAYPDQPATVERYQAWPVWENTVPYTQCLADSYWRVVLTLPAADQASTVDAANGLINEAATALYGLGQIATIRPGRLILGSDDVAVPIVQFELTY